VLCGREREVQAIAALLDEARASRSGALVLRGEPGVGKTALLEEARAEAVGMHVLGARGVQSESELPFAGLHQLLRPAFHLRDRLPPAQAAALQSAFGFGDSDGGDRFLISVACLTLLSELAEERPVLCLVDDAQWLDMSSADALAFVARRLYGEGIVMLFAARDGPDAQRFEARGLPELALRGLDAAAAAKLVDREAGDDVAPAVRDRLVAHADGNALALVELPKALTPAQLAGAERLPDEIPLTPNVERMFLDRVRALPEPTQRLLALIAAEDTGWLAPILRAADAAGIAPDALRPAEEASLVSVRDRRVEMRHPLVRSAVLQGLSSDERRAAHRALAAVLDDELGADRRAWHLAAASVDPDPRVAADLEATAERARRRSGHAAAAAALERAADLSADLASQARRVVAAAEAAWHAGQTGRASALLDRAEPLIADPRLRMEADLVRGEILLRCGSLIEACDVLMAGAARAAPLDTRKALEMLMYAREAAGWAGDTPRTVAAGRRAAELARSDDPETRYLGDLLDGVGRLYEGETAIGVPLVRDVLARTDQIDEPRWVGWAATGAQGIGDEARAEALHHRGMLLARSSGAVDKLTYVLLAYVLMGVLAGRFDVATEAAEGLRLAEDAGLPNAASAYLAMHAWFDAQRGRDEECRAAATAAIEGARRSQGGAANAMAEWGLGVLALSRRRAEEAVGHLQAVGDERPGRGQPYFALMAAPDLVEALAIAGRLADARAASAAFEAFARPGAPDWALALAARCRALRSDDPIAGLDEALRLTPVERPFDRARTALLLGEYLSRAARRADARAHLAEAQEAFEDLGAAGWAARAGDGLRASGGTAEEPDPSALWDLTPEELQIARLVADGHSNRDVAARLFLSPRTVEGRLRAIFGKLDVSSRVELAALGFGTEGANDVLRSRLARAGLAELFRDLRTLRGAALQDALRSTLGDRELVVAYRLDGGHADAAGAPVALPAPGDGRATAPIEVDGDDVAVLVYDAALDDDPELVEAVCAATAIAVEKERLHAQSQVRLAELQASRQRIVAAGDAERRRLERDLHDGAQQRLVALGIQLRLVQAHIRRDPSAAEALVTAASDELAQSLAELRELARGIHPAVLHHGVAAALDALATRSPIPTDVSCDVPERLPETIELALYFVACEALANVAKYAEATAASVRLWRTEGGVAIEIADNGVGGAEPAGGSGLRGLRDRVEALAGMLVVTSPVGEGTVVTAELPCSAVPGDGHPARTGRLLSARPASSP
jgi:signal transduction histidine kinase